MFSSPVRLIFRFRDSCRVFGCRWLLLSCMFRLLYLLKSMSFCVSIEGSIDLELLLCANCAAGWDSIRWYAKSLMAILDSSTLPLSFFRYCSYKAAPADPALTDMISPWPSNPLCPLEIAESWWSLPCMFLSLDLRTEVGYIAYSGLRDRSSDCWLPS